MQQRGQEILPSVIPGARGEPLSPAMAVLRLAKVSMDGKFTSAAFTLSTADEASELKSLSVYADCLTTPLQATLLIEESKRADYGLCAKLSVNEIRNLRPEPDSLDVPYLDVVWDPMFDKNSGRLDIRPGARGHSGVTGLNKPSGLPNASNYYKSLRSKLADMANADIRLIQ